MYAKKIPKRLFISLSRRFYWMESEVAHETAPLRVGRLYDGCGNAVVAIIGGWSRAHSSTLIREVGKFPVFMQTTLREVIRRKKRCKR